MNTNCNFILHQYYLNKDNAIEIIRFYDIIVDATDNFNTRYIIDKFCYILHKTYIYGAINKFEGQIATLNYKNGIRYKSIYRPNSERENNMCTRNGIMGISTGYIGILQTIETIKIILGLCKKCKNFLLSYNIITTKSKKQKIYLTRDNTQNINYVNNILNNITNETSKKNIIIDLRNEFEFINKHKNCSINIPLYKLKFDQTIQLIKHYFQNTRIVLYCDSNEKSLTGSYILKNHRINSIILK